MQNAAKVQYGGLSAWGFLAALWLTLKLGGVTEIADWSWFWVLSPIWVWWSVVLVLAVIVGLARRQEVNDD